MSNPDETFKDPKQVDAEKKPEEIKTTTDLFNRATAMTLEQSSGFILNENMQKLCKKDTFLISGKDYNRRKLNPRQKQKLLSLTTKYAVMDDADESTFEEKLRLQCEAAQLALTNFTEADYNKEDMDAMMLDQVLAACVMISKGFRGV